MASFRVTDAVKEASRNLIVKLNDDEIEEIVHKLIAGDALINFIKEMETLIFEKDEINKQLIK